VSCNWQLGAYILGIFAHIMQYILAATVYALPCTSQIAQLYMDCIGRMLFCVSIRTFM